MYDQYNIALSTFTYGPDKSRSNHRTLATFRLLPTHSRFKRERVVSYTIGDKIWDNYEFPLINEMNFMFKGITYSKLRQKMFQLYLTELLHIKQSELRDKLTVTYCTSVRVTYDVYDNKDIWLDLIKLDRMKFCC